MSSELPEPDGAPVRVRLLGENLIAFRVTSGKVGLIQNHCPHRGASLFFGRNEEEGLRCVYHGWKFDCEGALRRHAERAGGEQLQDEGAHATAYPCVERNGIIWTYMGPRADAAAACPTSSRTCCRQGEYRSRRCCASATGSRGSRATSTRATSASCTSAPSSPSRPSAGHVRLLPRHRSRAEVRGRRHGLRHLVRRLPPGGSRTRTTGASPTSCSRSTR